MYNRGKQRLGALEDKLAVLREEARGGYAKDEVRRNRIKADLEAERLAKDKFARERLAHLLATTPSASSPRTTASVRSRAGATMTHHDNAELFDEGRGSLQGPAPYEEGNFADFLLPDGDGTSDAAAEDSAAVTDAVVSALQRHAQAYQSLCALAEDYVYDTRLEAKLKRVQDRDAITGLPSVMHAPSAAEAAGELGLDPLEGLEDLDSHERAHSASGPLPPPSSTLAGSALSSSVPHDVYALPPSAQGRPRATVPRAEVASRASVASRVSRASRASLASSHASTALTAPRRPPREALSTQGTAVAVSFGQSQVRALQKMVRERRRRTDGDRGGSDQAQTPAHRLTAASLQSMWPPLTETVTRVLKPTVVLFCAICARLFEAELEAGGEAALQRWSVPTCSHCGTEAALDAESAWWAATPAPVPAPVRPATHAPDSAAVPRDAPVGNAVSGGTDSVGFPDDNADDAGSFQAALAQVRAAIAASKKTTTSTGVADGIGAAAARGHAVSAGTGTEVETRPSPAELAQKWSESLKGVFLMHMWDAVQDGA